MSKQRKPKIVYNYQIFQKLRVAIDRVTYAITLNTKKHTNPKLETIQMLLRDVIQHYHPAILSRGKPKISITTRIEVIRLVKLKCPLKLIAYKCQISMSSISNIIKEEKIQNYPQRSYIIRRGSSEYHPNI